jgi:intracellular septation protein A
MQSKPQAFIPSLSWRSAVPSIKRALVRFAFVGMTPIVAFYLGYRMLGPIEGMLAGTATATVALGIQAIRMRRFDPIGLVPIGAVLIQGGVGIAFQSVDLYLAAPALETALWGVVLLGSVLVGRPLILLVANELELLPSSIRGIPTVRHASRQLTVCWGLLAFLKAGTRLFLLDILPLELFLIANSVVISSMNALMLLFTMWWVARAARRVAPPSSLAASTA